MKAHLSVMWLALALLSILVCPDLIQANSSKSSKRPSTSKLPTVGATACRYHRKGEESPCNSTSSTKTVTLLLRKGNPPTCQPTKVVIKRCHDDSSTRKKKLKGCRYERKGSAWSECDSATKQMTKLMKLRHGSASHCPPTYAKTKKCRSNGKKGPRKSRKGCLYRKQPWSACDLTSKTRQREMVLQQGDPALCLPKKVVTKSCRKECHYEKSEWSACNRTTNQIQRSLVPRRGEPTKCEIKVETRSCHKHAELVAAKSNKCKYSFSEWSSCDLRSNTMTQMMTLKSGDPNVCQRSRKLTKKCKIACKFRQGNWSPCDAQTDLTTRVDTLIKGSPKDCDLTREITRKCRRVCKYAIGDWGACDPVTNHRTRVKKLIEGDSKKCQAEEIVTKPCTKKDGEERCFFGPWGDFGPCTNGVMTKHRPVLQGGVVCERKGVITKACDKNS